MYNNLTNCSNFTVSNVLGTIKKGVYVLMTGKPTFYQHKSNSRE